MESAVNYQSDYDYEEINDSNPLANYWLEGNNAYLFVLIL
jgi:hypothetical protein